MAMWCADCSQGGGLLCIDWVPSAVLCAGSRCCDWAGLWPRVLLAALSGLSLITTGVPCVCSAVTTATCARQPPCQAPTHPCGTSACSGPGLVYHRSCDCNHYAATPSWRGHWLGHCLRQLSLYVARVGFLHSTAPGRCTRAPHMQPSSCSSTPAGYPMFEVLSMLYLLAAIV